MKREYFSTTRDDHRPAGDHRRGGDALDIPGYLESRDPEKGDLVWRWNTTPRAGRPARQLARRRRDGARGGCVDSGDL